MHIFNKMLQIFGLYVLILQISPRTKEEILLTPNHTCCDYCFSPFVNGSLLLIFLFCRLKVFGLLKQIIIRPYLMNVVDMV